MRASASNNLGFGSPGHWEITSSKATLTVVVICSLLFLGLFAGIPSVKAQVTSISNVAYPSSAIYNLDTETSSPPLIVKATVNYEDARAGYYLDIGIFDLDAGNLVSGTGNAAPTSCATTSQYAGCDVPLSSPHGSENVEFLLGRPNSVWNLAIISILMNSTGGLVISSESEYSFTITVHTGLTLQVDVPIPVPVVIDGVNGTGVVRLSLPPGNHAVAVPEILPFENDTRLKFTGWSDGSAEANRTVALNYDTTLQANYVTQYYLTIISPEVNVTGTGWYDNGSTARLSIPTTELPMSMPLGALGAKWDFVGWSENGMLSSTMPTQTMQITSPHTIRTEWRADFTLPILIFAIIIVATGLAATLRTRSSRESKRQRKTRRSH